MIARCNAWSIIAGSDAYSPQLSSIKRKRKYGIVAFLLIAFMAVRLFVNIRITALTTDEFIHIPAGFVYWKAQRFDFNPEHPPLIKMLAGLPLLILNPQLPEDPARKKDWSNWFRFCSNFFHEAVGEERRIVTYARIPMILVSCFLAMLIYIWTSTMFGPSAGVFSILLYTMEPNIFAFSRLVYTDIGASLAYLAIAYVTWRCVKSPRFLNFLSAIFVVSVSILVKHSLIVAPLLWLAALAGIIISKKLSIRRGLAYVTLLLAVFFLVLNLGYGFQSHAFNSRDLKMVKDWFGLHSDWPLFNSLLDRCSFIPVPSAYINGLSLVMAQNRVPNPAYLFGRFSFTGRWHYFPLAFLVKTPIAFIVIVVLSLIWLCRRALLKQHLNALLLLAPVIVYCIFAMSSNLNSGLRHFLPVYPFLFISAGGLLQTLWEKRSKLFWVVAALGVWMTISSLLVRYDPIEYFNELVGGPDNGWRYLGESNLDAGQNFLKLADFIERNNPQPLYMDLIGVDMNVFSEKSLNMFLPYNPSVSAMRQVPYSYNEEF